MNHRISAFVKHAHAAGVWDRVIIMQDSNHEAFDPEVLEIYIGETARFFYFSWGFPGLTKLFSKAVQRNWIVCLSDEGTLTYQPQASLRNWLSLGGTTNGFDYSAVAEIWLINPGLFLEQTHAKIVPIDVNAFIEKLRADGDAKADFRRFFLLDDMSHCQKFSEAIYLRQYFSAAGILAEPLDAYLDREFIKGLTPLEVCIKDHPAHNNEHYDSENEKINYSGPIEALVTERLVANEPVPKWFVSPMSSAMFNCATLGAGKNFVFLYKILEQYCDWVGPRREDLLARCRAIFPDALFFIPETWDEYNRVILDQVVPAGSKCLKDNNVYELSGIDLRGINTLVKQVASKHAQQIESFRQILEKRDDEIGNLKQILKKRDGEITAIVQSKSWRFTSPCRAVGRWVRRPKLF